MREKGSSRNERVKQSEAERLALAVKGYWVAIIKENELGQSCSTHE